MKSEVRRIQLENYLRALAVLLLLVSPFAGSAQVDDIYFVPKKSEKKTLVVERISDKYGIDSEVKSPMRDVDEYNRRSSGYTNDPEAYIEENYSDEYESDADEYQEYDYSTRIIRFHSPRRAFSSIYWDLSYGCGINDWYVYDNGYTIDIYPTVNNPLYFFGDFSFSWNFLNYYNWRSWYNYYSWGYTPYWGWHHPGYHCYDHYWFGHGWHGHHWNPHIPAGNWNYGRRPIGRIPHNGAVTARRDNVPSNSSVRGGNDSGRVASNGNSGGVDLRGVRKGSDRDNGSVAVRQNEMSGKTNRGGVNLRGNNAGNGSERNGNGQVREVRFGSNSKSNRQVGENRARRQQSARSLVNSNDRKRSSSVSDNASENVRQKRNSSTLRKEQSGTVNRRGSSSSGSYNRQSSTSVTRSRNSSTQSRGNSSYSSGSSSSRKSGSSFSSGSSSRSSSGSSLRGSSSGGSRSSGGGRGR